MRHAEISHGITAQQIDSPTATRAIAALLVVIHHFGPTELFAPAWRIGNIAVGYFFVLSGFVMTLAYANGRVNYGQYIKRRLARILPVYLLALFLVCFPPQDNFDSILTTPRMIREAILGATLLQAYVPTYPLTLNLPAWTISVEVFFYLLFPILLRFRQRSDTGFAIFAVSLFIVSQAIHLHFYPLRQHIGDTIVDLVFFSPFIHLSQFLLGMLAGRIYLTHRRRLPDNALVPLAILVLCVAAIALRIRYSQFLSFQVGLIDPLFMLLILSIAINNPAALRLRPLVFLGEISYGIYILQAPMHSYLATLNQRHWQFEPVAFFAIPVAALVVFTTIVYFAFEMPLKRAINSIRIGT